MTIQARSRRRALGRGAVRSPGSSSSTRSTSTPGPEARRRTWPWPCLATIVLYYTYYTQTGVTPNILRYFHMSFTYYVWIVIISNLIGAFASLPASQDRPPRAVQRRHLRPAHRRPAGHVRRAERPPPSGLRHRHLGHRPGRGGDPGGHPGHGPRLQPAARPGLGHGLLDDRSGGGKPDHVSIVANHTPRTSPGASRTGTSQF